MNTVLIIDPTQPIVRRLEEIARSIQVKSISTESAREALSILQSDGKNIDMVITEIRFDRFNGVDLIRNIRSSFPAMPILVLTSSNKRGDFVDALKAGASDYILKPFDNDMLANRMLKDLTSPMLPPEQIKPANEVNVDLTQVIELEMKKAQKGQYNLLLGLFVIFKPTGRPSPETDNEYIHISNMVFPQLKSIFWDTDFFTQYGNHMFLGLFPFSDAASKKALEEKIMNKAYDLKSSGVIPQNYLFTFACSLYPTESGYVGTPEQLIDTVHNQLIEKEDAAKKKKIQ